MVCCLDGKDARSMYGGFSLCQEHLDGVSKILQALNERYSEYPSSLGPATIEEAVAMLREGYISLQELTGDI